MSGFSIQVSNEKLARANAALARIQRAFPLAVARAANRAMYEMRPAAIESATERYFVKSSDIRKTITFRKATSGNLMGTMVSRGRRRSLKNYMLTPSRPSKGTKTTVQAAVKKEGGLKTLTKAFLVKRASGYFPFYRIGYDPANRQRKGIRSYVSPSIPQILKNEEVSNIIEERAIDKFNERLDHEVWYLRGQI